MTSMLTLRHLSAVGTIYVSADVVIGATMSGSNDVAFGLADSESISGVSADG